MSAMGSSSQGIDVSATVAQLIYAESARERQWQAQQKTLETQTTALNDINSALSAVEDAVNALGDPVSALTSMTTTSSNNAMVSASAVSGTQAGSHIVVVSNLATTASWYSGPAATADTALAAGSFSLTIAGTTTSVTVGSGVNTLNQLASYINQNFPAVRASIVNDATGSRLAIVAANSGSAADFTVTNGSGVQFTRAAQGNNASLTFDGIPISSATNSVSGVVAGLTLNLQGADPNAEVVVGVAPDKTQITDAVNKFVTAYNSAIGKVSQQFAYDQASKTAGPLAGDSAVRMLQSSLLAATSYSTDTGTISSLRSLGIKMNDDGTLSVDSTVLNGVIQNNLAGLQTFMQGTASNGFAAYLKTQMDVFSDPVQGAFTVDLKSISDQHANLQDQIDNFETYITGREDLLYAQYNKIDILLQQLPGQQAQINAILGNSSGGNK